MTNAIPSLARLGVGSFTLSGGKVDVSGEAAFPKAADEIKPALEAALGPGFALEGTSESQLRRRSRIRLPAQLRPSPGQGAI